MNVQTLTVAEESEIQLAKKVVLDLLKNLTEIHQVTKKVQVVLSLSK